MEGLGEGVGEAILDGVTRGGGGGGGGGRNGGVTGVIPRVRGGWLWDLGIVWLANYTYFIYAYC